MNPRTKLWVTFVFWSLFFVINCLYAAARYDEGSDWFWVSAAAAFGCYLGANEAWDKL